MFPLRPSQQLKRKRVSSLLLEGFSAKKKRYLIISGYICYFEEFLNVGLQVKGKEVGDSTLTLNQTNIGLSDGDIGDGMNATGKLGQKAEFDRTRQKKK